MFYQIKSSNLKTFYNRQGSMLDLNIFTFEHRLYNLLLFLALLLLSLGDEVDGEDMVAVDGDGDANVVQLKNLLLKKMKLLKMGKTTSLTVQNEVPSHGDVVDGEDEVVDGDGDVSADRLKMLL